MGIGVNNENKPKDGDVQVVVNPGAKSTFMTILMWVAVTVGWLVSIFTVIQEMCLATACSDAASFTLFGFNMGWSGIAYFSLILIVLWLRNRDWRLEWALSLLLFGGIGAELRLLWIQKYVIGSWCPLCVTICGALFLAGLLLAVEKVRETGRKSQGGVKNLLGWVVVALAMIAIGLAIAAVGVKALT